MALTQGAGKDNFAPGDHDDIPIARCAEFHQGEDSMSQ